MDIYESVLIKYVRRCERLRHLRNIGAPQFLIDREIQLINICTPEFERIGYNPPPVGSEEYNNGLNRFKEIQYLSQMATLEKLSDKHRYKFLITITDDEGHTDSILAADNKTQALGIVNKFNERGYEALLWPENDSIDYNNLLLDYYEQEGV